MSKMLEIIESLRSVGSTNVNQLCDKLKEELENLDGRHFEYERSLSECTVHFPKLELNLYH